MAQYINKDALIAEIERKKDVEVDYDESSNNFASYADQIHYSALDSIENFINTLEVKEVDLNDEKCKDLNGDGTCNFASTKLGRTVRCENISCSRRK